MRTLWDGVTASNLPVNAELVAGYVEGRYSWSQADWDRFPNSLKLTIAIWAADADILDIETGDATPAMGPAWVQRQHARGLAIPTVYCNRSTWPAVQSALGNAGFVNGQHYDLWLADYTQAPHCPSYAAACQYADPGPYDLSLCQDYWPRGVQDMQADERALLFQLFNMVKYGSDGTVGQSKLDADLGELWNFQAYGVAKTDGQPALATAQINGLQKQIATLALPQAAKVDEKALAAALTPVLVEALSKHVEDPHAIATAVTAEVGAWLTAALKPK